MCYRREFTFLCMLYFEDKEELMMKNLLMHLYYLYGYQIHMHFETKAREDLEGDKWD